MATGPQALRALLREIDGADYGAYQSLRGVHRFDGFELDVDRVPKDPYAPPGAGIFRIRVPLPATGLSDAAFSTPAREVATRDLVARRVHAAADRLCGGRRGTGWSGVVTVTEPGQAVLDRSTVVRDGDVLEVRAFVGLPGRGRRVDARLAEVVLLGELPAIVQASLAAATHDADALDRHLRTVEDARALRGQLSERGLVAFLADGAVLPRASGVDDRPLARGAVPLRSPEALRVTLDTPHAGPVTGLGVPAGITVLVGGGYHGKSTLLAAIAAGVHDHVPGDGRERCVSVPSAQPVRAAPGRSVAGVDVSGFIGGLPDGRDTAAFSTVNASGSTSQAAAVVEALESDARLLLVDEDASATNLLVRDARMQSLVAREDEPITTLLDRVEVLRDDLGVSTVLVVGGAGDWLDVADRVVQLTSYVPHDVTDRARQVATALPTARRDEATTPFTPPTPRRPDGDSIPTKNLHGKRSVRAVSTERIVLGPGELDLRDVADQLREVAQTRSIAAALELLAERFDGTVALADGVSALLAEVDRDGLDVLDPRGTGNLAAVRVQDVVAAVNRVRGLRVRTGDPPLRG